MQMQVEFKGGAYWVETSLPWDTKGGNYSRKYGIMYTYMYMYMST